MKSENLIGFSAVECEALACSLGEKPFKGRQLYRQIYLRKCFSFGEMTDLSKGFRAELARRFTLAPLRIAERSQAPDGTVKYLLELGDGKRIESVYIPEGNRETLCISSQVGCDLGCTFCLTAQMGFHRNLTTAEIVGQVWSLIHDGVLKNRQFNVVFMGMGEPLYNYQNVMKAFHLLRDPAGFGLSHRKVTVSTAGVVPVLERLSKESFHPNLAVSLNATTNADRDRLMPINRKWDIQTLLGACRRFPLDARRRITFEYVLLRGETDRTEDAYRLAKLLKDIRSKVNLIPYNENPGLGHSRPGPESVRRFQNILQDQSVPVFVRKSRGEEVSAACGQLAYLEQE